MADPGTTDAPVADPGTTDAPVASVIVVSRDRRDALASALASVEAQGLSRGAFEIVAVDDGSTDGTWEMLDGVWGSGGGAASRIALRNERSLGPGLARNRAAGCARGRILLFLDSDCTACPGWIEALVAAFDDPAVGAAGSAEGVPEDASALERAVHFALTSPLTTGRVRGGEGRRAARYRPRSFGMAVRRDLFERAGGFPDMFYGEDLDLSLRVAAQGFRAVFAARARVCHRRRAALEGIAAQAFRMGRARARLARRDRRHAEAVYLLPPVVLVSLLLLVAGALAAPPLRPVLVAAVLACGAYLSAVSLAAARATRDAGVAWRAPLVVAVQQAAYGAGFLAGLAPAERGVATRP